LVHNYDRLGPCLGSGGMGCVWAAHLSEGTVFPPWSNNGWVAVKAIPLEMVDGSGAEGLRECLSTFKDLNPAHVVRYERFWLEKLQHLPPAVCEFVESRTGVKTAKPLRCTEKQPQRKSRECSCYEHAVNAILLPLRKQSY